MGSNWIEIDIPQAGEQVAIGFDAAASESPTP
jgi:hypothetical protein